MRDIQSGASVNSPRQIPPEERLILALDGMNEAQALVLVNRLVPKVRLFKVGLELFSRAGLNVVKQIGQAGGKVFLDLKLLDIPATMNHALEVIYQHSSVVRFVTVHAFNPDLGALSKQAGPEGVKLLAVTVLTSVNQQGLRRLGVESALDEYVLSLARHARDSGCPGVVCSGHEAALLKKTLGSDLLVVTPGIRPQQTAQTPDDQKRTLTPTAALANGADHLVVGRPIHQAPDPLRAALSIQEEIRFALQ